MNDLSNRNNIVNYFYDNLHTATLSSSTSDKIVLVFDNDKAKITKTNDSIIFDMELSGSQVEEYQDTFNHRTERINHFFKGLATVMEYNRISGEFKMVSCSEYDSWLTTKYIHQSVPATDGFGSRYQRMLVLETFLNSHYSRIPLTEEEHFQRGTSSDGIVLDLEICLKLHNIFDRLDGLGEIVKSNSDTYVNLIFENNLRKGG